MYGWRSAGIVAALFAATAGLSAQSAAYTGFDQNTYPGDAALPVLHRTMSYAGYWLNVPPGAKVNSWRGKREMLRRTGFGFLVLFNGHLEAELKGRDAAALGRREGLAAARAAAREGFPGGAIVFLDIEEGGRMTPAQAKYFVAWTKALRESKYAAGVYCTGIEVEDDPGKTISTADDVRQRDQEVALWVANDACPPAPGCVVQAGMKMADSGRLDVLVWQYAQSPMRPEYAKSCKATYAKDGNCYAPGTPHSESSLLDLNLSASADPSKGR